MVSCYGAPTKNSSSKCCKTCAEVKTAYKNMGWKLDPHNISQCLGKFISFEWVGYNILFLKLKFEYLRELKQTLLTLESCFW